MLPLVERRSSGGSTLPYQCSTPLCSGPSEPSQQSSGELVAFISLLTTLPDGPSSAVAPHSVSDKMESTSRPAPQSPEGLALSSPLPTKRKRYTPVACDQCKRRKVKCDGKTPCHRCVRLPGECVYTQRGKTVESRQKLEWKEMNEKLAKLQEQVNLLVSSAASVVPSMYQLAPPSPESMTLRDHNSRPPDLRRREPLRSAYPRRAQRPARPPQYMGPTSSSFSFGVAKRSLQEMGIQDGADSSDSATPLRSPSSPNRRLVARDPLYSIPRKEAIRLIETYEEECGTIYPFLDAKLVLKTVLDFYDSTNTYPRSPYLPNYNDENMFAGGLLDIAKLAVAIALVIEAGGPTVRSTELLESVESGFDGRVCGLSVDILGMQALTLMSILQFHCDEEVLAWRAIGFAGRAAVEMGLHRREMYFANFHDHQQRSWANKLFWCIYVLDRRWSFGTGLPFTMHDHDIDPELPEPTDSESSLLKIMIAYGRIGSKVWKATSNSNQPAKKQKISFLDFQVQAWQNSLPPELQLHPGDDHMLEGHSRTRNRLRVLLYIRANQMRLLLFRRALLTPKTLIADFSGAERVVDVAKDNIRVIHKLNQVSDIYSSQQACFNYFLVSALAVLFLAFCHGAAHFNDTCHEEFSMALDLVRGFSAKSHVARKLWKSIKHLQVIGPKLGILPTQDQDSEKQGETRDGTFLQQRSVFEDSTLSTEYEGGLDYLTTAPFGNTVSPTNMYPFDGDQLGNELTNLFKAIEPVQSGISAQLNDNHQDFGSYNYETAEDLSRSLWDLF